VQQLSAREALRVNSMEKREKRTRLDVGETRYLFYLVGNLRPFYLFSRKEERKEAKKKNKHKPCQDPGMRPNRACSTWDAGFGHDRNENHGNDLQFATGGGGGGEGTFTVGEEVPTTGKCCCQNPSQTGQIPTRSSPQFDRDVLSLGVLAFALGLMHSIKKLITNSGVRRREKKP
jgi:hypothetical protein